jgi:hypothetical protein
VLKNVTITADEKVLKWARHEAVDKGISVSKLVSQILEKEMRSKDAYWRAYDSWMKREPFLKGPIEKMDREKLYDRGRR